MTKIKKFKGGVRLSRRYHGTRDAALQDFMAKAKYELLSNTTIACMAVRATLPVGVTSHFRMVRTGNLESEVRELFIKLMLVDDSAPNVGMYGIPGRTPYDAIEIGTVKSFNDELATQKDIYRKTLLSPTSLLDPICPALVGTGKLPDATDSSSRFRGLSFEALSQLDKIRSATTGRYGNRVHLRFIAMELMEGFVQASNLPLVRWRNREEWDTRNERLVGLHWMIQFEFARLNQLGYHHKDAHFGNVMINTTYPYFTDNKNSPMIGRAIILDFGRTGMITDSNQQNMAHTGQINPPYPKSVLQIERFYNWNTEGLPRLDPSKILTMDQYKELETHRVNYLNNVRSNLLNYCSSCRTETLEPFTERNVITELAIMIRRDGEGQWFGGSEVKIENVFGNNKMENNKMENNKMENNKMENNRMNYNSEFEEEEPSEFEMKEAKRMGDNIMKSLKSHKSDWSEFLKPMTEQLKTMDFEELFGILRDEYDNKYAEDVLLTIKPADKKNSGKRSDGKRSDGKRSDGKRSNGNRSDSKRNGGKRKSKKNQKTQKIK